MPPSDDDEQRTVTPRLRFPEFCKRKGWEGAELGTIVTIHKGKGLSKADVVPNGVRPCIRYGELYTRYGEVIDVVHSRTNSPVSELFLSRSNDVIIPASGETKLDIAKASCVVHNDVALGSDLNVLRTSQNGVFLSYLLNGSKRFDIARVAQGDTVAHLYPSQLQQITVATPTAAEQQKIADCLTSLDDCVAAQGRKVEALKAHKKGLMQQLFPREGETLPRLRFPEFRDAGEWEVRTLRDVCDLKAGDFVSASAIAERGGDGLFPCYGGNGLRGYVETFTHNGLYVLVGRQGALCGNVNLFEGRFHATEHALVATQKIGIDVNWLFYALDRLALNRFSIGQAQPGLSVGVLNGVGIEVARETAEQRRIASCLSSLDARVAAEGEKLAALKLHKKGLMQQLFPLPEGLSYA